MKKINFLRILTQLTKIKFLVAVLIFFCIIVLMLAVRGNPGSPNEDQLNLIEWRERGPFEVSPERGRFALVYSLVENHSFKFTTKLAQFADPDVAVTTDGQFASLFAPVVSFVAIPGYLVGKAFGLSQVGSFAAIALFAVLNVVLIYLIAIRLGLNRIASALASLTYVFATPAFAYSVTLYQHQISTFLILASIYVLVRWKNIWSLAAIWFMAALSIPIDYPNLVLMFPIGLVALGRIINVQKVKNSININVKLLGFLTFITVVLPILFFAWFNKMSYGNPLQLSGTLKTVRDFKPDQIYGQNTVRELQSGKEKTAVGFFKTRNMLNGLNIHLFSPDRGVLVFTPVLLFAVLGIYFERKRGNQYVSLLVFVAAVDLILYSMWGDPWGGWAFGSRYLIPAYAVLAIFIAAVLTRFRKNIVFIFFFFVVLTYSVFVNTLGALTSNANPPKGEAIELAKTSGLVQKYTYFRNYDYLRLGNSKSFVFRAYAGNYLSAYQYYLLITSMILIFAGFLAFRLFTLKEEN